MAYFPDVFRQHPHAPSELTTFDASQYATAAQASRTVADLLQRLEVAIQYSLELDRILTERESEYLLATSGPKDGLIEFKRKLMYFIQNGHLSPMAAVGSASAAVASMDHGGTLPRVSTCTCRNGCNSFTCDKL